MAKLRKLINDYGEVLDFNHKVENFFEENHKFLRKHYREKYGPKTLLEAMPSKMTVSIGLKIKGRLTLVENKDSSTEQIFNGAEIHCVALEDIDPIMFGFAINLVAGNGNDCVVFPLAKNKECCLSTVKTVSFNRRKKMISQICHPILIFKSRKDFNNVLALSQKAVQLFNDNLPKDSKLILNANL